MTQWDLVLDWCLNARQCLCFLAMHYAVRTARWFGLDARCRIKIWYPETCKCAIAEFRDRDPMGLKTAHHVKKRCAVHASVPRLRSAFMEQTLYEVVYASPSGENRRKNQIAGWFLHRGLSGGWTQWIKDSTGQRMPQFRPGVGVFCAWTGEGAVRILHVTLVGTRFSAPVHAELRSWIAQSAHVGRVIVPETSAQQARLLMDAARQARVDTTVSVSRPAGWIEALGANAR
jgi:hypothetical protein